MATQALNSRVTVLSDKNIMASLWTNEKREKLIELVRNEESIWRKASKNHRRSDTDNLKWQIISSELKITVDEAQKEWNCLKKSFYYQKNQRIPSGSGSCKKYRSKNAPFYEQLSFLQENLRGRRQIDTIRRNVLLPTASDYVSDDSEVQPTIPFSDVEEEPVRSSISISEEVLEVTPNPGNVEYLSVTESVENSGSVSPILSAEGPESIERNPQPSLISTATRRQGNSTDNGPSVERSFASRVRPMTVESVVGVAGFSGGNVTSVHRPSSSSAFQTETFPTRPGRTRRVETQNRRDVFYDNLNQLVSMTGESLRDNLRQLCALGNSTESPGEIDSFLMFLKSIMESLTSDKFREFRLKILRLYFEIVNED